VKANHLLRVTLAAVIGLVSSSLLPAQSFLGGVRGLVQDSGSAVVASAKVNLINDATQSSRSTVTNGQGEYAFSQIEPATYSIVVESPGFKKVTRKDVIVATAQTVTVDLKLEIGDVTTSVSVTEEVPLIETSNAQNGQVLDTQKMTDLPNLGRNPFLLSKLSTNVVTAGDPRFNRFQDQSGSSQISVAGGPVRGNNYLIDGIPITDSTNRAVIIPSIESTQEMKLQTGTYDATMGRTGGGVFNVLLKSGSNQYHGVLMGSTRQTDWAANNFFLNAAGTARPESTFYNWAGSFGGPVIIPKVYNGKNKTFFWVATESYRQKSPLSDQYALPTALERAGNYSQSSTTIYNPLSARPCAATDNCPSGVTQIRTPFAGNIIPSTFINPVGAAILGYLPNPQRTSNTDANNFTGIDTLTDRADEYTAKGDQIIRDWWKVSASYMHYKSREPGGNTLGTLPGASGNGPYLLFRKVDATAVNSIMTLNPTTVLTVRYGFNRFPNITEGISFGFNPSTLGLPTSFSNTIQAQYFPQIDLSTGGNSISSVSPSIVVFSSKNASVGVSKYMGRHSISAGFDYRLIHTDFTALTTSAGDFKFNGVFSREYPSLSNGSGADFADLLLGYPSSGSVTTTSKLYDYVKYYSGYVQDDFRVSAKLTVNFGLRYEYETGVAENNNQLAVGFNQTAVNPIAANVTGIVPNGVIQFAGQNGNATTCCSPSKKKFGPRFGVAYQLNSKTTIRGGWGMFYAPTLFTNDASLAPGYTQTTTYVASNDGNVTPANNLSNPFPTGVLQPSGNSLGALTAIGSSFNFIDQHRTGGLVKQFSFDIQRELPYNIALELGYVGSRSSNLQSGTGTGALDINQVPDQFLSLGSALNNKVANPFFGHGGTGVIGAATVSQAQLLLPFPEYSTIGETTNVITAQYDSLVAKAQKRFSAGLTFLTTLTWSKNYDNSYASGSANAFNTFSGSTPPGQPQDVYNLNREWSLASVDTPITVGGAFTYELPFGTGKKFLNSSKLVDYAIGGWKLNAVTTYRTGFPLFVYQTNNNSVIGTGEQRPNATGVSPAVSGSVESRVFGYINPAAFSTAPAFTFGNISRSLDYRGPGMKNWDVSLFKDFKIRERLSGQFRAEALNATNSPLFANPNTQFGTANFGKITYQSNLARQLSLGVRFMF
jgi:hypothetical protein